jgi:photosystem II stability/assembly factor-like uncharacterized protein
MDDQIGIAGNLGKGSFDNTFDTIPIYRTSDGGQNWTGFNPDPANLKGLCALQKINANTIYGAGRVRGPGQLIKSTDKGLTWTTIDLLATAGLGAATDLYFSSPDTGFVIGMNAIPFATGNDALYKGKIIYTTNGGQTWATVLEEPLNPTYFWKISFPTKQVGYVSLQQNTANRQSVIYYKTENGGQTWVRNIIPTALFGNPVNFATQGIGFANENLGWIGGGGLEPNFLQTNDGGTTWSNITSSFSYRVNKIRFLENFAYASGIRILRTLIPVSNKPEMAQDKSVQIFPNPLKEFIQVQLDETVWKNANVSIHSLNGQKLTSRSAGNETRINLSDLSPGTYFLRVTSEEKLWFRRIVKE